MIHSQRVTSRVLPSLQHPAMPPLLAKEVQVLLTGSLREGEDPIQIPFQCCDTASEGQKAAPVEAHSSISQKSENHVRRTGNRDRGGVGDAQQPSLPHKEPCEPNTRSLAQALFLQRDHATLSHRLLHLRAACPPGQELLQTSPMLAPFAPWLFGSHPCKGPRCCGSQRVQHACAPPSQASAAERLLAAADSAVVTHPGPVPAGGDQQ
mmetsp:Transcript_62938/g.146549  ORF Transcript_62938/g.146549 Transcript_62938/m.146549 type:complete len:208 (-) Transcript_62938:80-703(-)